MVFAKRDTTREGGHESRKTGTNGKVTVARTDFRTFSQASIETFLEIMSSTMKRVAILEDRFRWPARKTSVRQQRSVEFLSSARLRLSDAVKTVAVKRELAAAGRDDFGWSPRETTIGRQRLLSGGAVVGSNAIPVARAACPEHSSEPLTAGEQCRARIDSCRIARGLSPKKRFVSAATRQALGTAATGNAEGNQAYGNSEDRSGGHQWNVLCNARNAPASEGRRTHPAKLARGEKAFAIRDSRRREVRASSRKEIPAAVHHRFAQRDLQGYAQGCGVRVRVERVQPLFLDAAGSRDRSSGDLRESNARVGRRFQIGSAPRKSRGILCGGWR
jgi:hypothetical protein